MRLIRDEYGYAHDPWDHRRYLKPLKKVKRMGWRLERMLIVDDTPEKCLRNYGNAIHPLPFEGGCFRWRASAAGGLPSDPQG